LIRTSKIQIFISRTVVFCDKVEEAGVPGENYWPWASNW